jgi:hypothetical protein
MTLIKGRHKRNSEVVDFSRRTDPELNRQDAKVAERTQRGKRREKA